MGLGAMALPLPWRPICAKGEGLEVAGWQTAVISAVPGQSGVTEPTVAGMVCGVVELNSSARPVMGLPWVSRTVVLRGWRVLTFTLMLLADGLLGSARTMDAAGQVEK